MNTKRKAEDAPKPCKPCNGNGKKAKPSLAPLQALPKNLFRFTLEFLQAQEVGVVLAVNSLASPEGRRQAWGHLYAKFVGPNHRQPLPSYYKISLFREMQQARQAEEVAKTAGPHAPRPAYALRSRMGAMQFLRLGVTKCPCCLALLERVDHCQKIQCVCGHVFCNQCKKALDQVNVENTDHFFCLPWSCAHFSGHTPHQHCRLWEQ